MLLTRRIALPVVTLLLSSHAFADSNKIPENPAHISFKPLDWKVPRGEPYRIVLSNGLIAYIAEDKNLPLASVSGYIRYGQVSDPAGKEGLCSLLAALMRTGGTQKYQSDSLDELIDRYALSVKISAGETQMQFGFSCLSQYLNLCLDLLDQMLMHPAFEEKKVKKTKDLFIEEIYHRFDNPGPILRSAYEKAMYSGQANAKMPTLASMRAITRNDLVLLHQKAFKTGAMICAASGNFSKDSLIKKLTAIFPRAAGGSPDSVFPLITANAPHKLLFINKAISQSYVKMGLPFIKRPHPDYYAVSVLNMVLGGESFTSRLGSRIRSDEGLTYSIYSNAESNYFFPGTFYIEFHTKTESTFRAIGLALEEVKRLKTEGITQEELDHAKKILIDGFPSMFRSPEDIVENYALNEYYKRSADHFAAYPQKIAALTLADIRAAAQKYLDPSAFTYTIVGDSSALFKNAAQTGFSLRTITPSKYVEPDSLPALP